MERRRQPRDRPLNAAYGSIMTESHNALLYRPTVIHSGTIRFIVTFALSMFSKKIANER
jgi:hypothetical protein